MANPSMNRISDSMRDGLRPASRTGKMRFAAGAATIVLLLFGYYVLAWGSYSGFAESIDTCEDLFCDFANFYYPMGASILRTGVPVPGFVYSPFAAILLSLFSPLEPANALAVWGILQAFFLFLYIHFFRRLVPAGLPIQLLFVALVLSSFPVLHNFAWGQVGVSTTVALLATLFFYQRRNRAPAAATLAFAASFKFFPIIFLAAIAARRDLRFLLFAAFVCLCALFVVPGVVLGIDGAMGFYGALFDSYGDMGWVTTNYNSQHLPHVLHRLMNSSGNDVSAFMPLLRLISYGIAVANLALLVLVSRQRLPRAELWSFHLLFLTVPFILNTSWPVDLVFLPFAQGFLAWWLLEAHPLPGTDDAAPSAPGRAAKPAARRRHTAALVLLLVSIVISNIVFFNAIGNRFIYGFLGFLLWADVLLLVASYVELLPAVLLGKRAPEDGERLAIADPGGAGSSRT